MDEAQWFLLILISFLLIVIGMIFILIGKIMYGSIAAMPYGIVDISIITASIGAVMFLVAMLSNL
ncbi:MAG: hypothetical protein U9Q27_01170 [Patescibacteria group bacterium]|nr:hypothetical protein [Patescibacteria group bacterium]